MGKNKKKNITRRIIYAFAILMVLYGLHVIIATRAIYALSNLTKTIHDHPLVVSNASLQADVNIIKMHRSLKDVVFLQDGARIQSTLAGIDLLEKQTLEQLRIVQKNILGNKGQTIAAETIKIFQDWAPIRANAIAKVENGDRELAARITRNESAAHVEKMEEKTLELANYARNKASGFLQESETVYNHIRTWSLLLFCLCETLFLGVAFFTIRRTLQGESKLAAEKEKLVVTLRSIGDGVITTDRNGKVTLINEAAMELTGWSEPEALGQGIEKIFKIINEITRIPCENPIKKVLATNGIVGLANHTILIARDGTERAIADSGSPIRSEEKDIIGVVLVFRDQTEERDYQDKISRNEKKYRLLSDNTLDVIWTMNLDLQFTYVNRAVLSFTGHTPEEWLGSHLADHCDAGNFAIMEDSIRQELAQGVEGTGVLFEAEMLKKDGDPIPVEIRGRVIFDEKKNPVGLQGVTRDISERKSAERRRNSLEKQLIQAQKMESVGRLAGGVAHDFNNMLNVIMGYAELMLEKIEPDNSMRHDLLEIQTAAQRSADITRQLLAFARQQTIAPKVLDLNSTVEKLLKMLRRLIGEDINLAWLPDTDLLPIKIDPTQLDQILANLCVNARDAVAGVGKITIETGNVSFDEAYCRDHVGFVPGEYVLLVVSDDGIGMDKTTQENIFEPFFTTKAVGSGTGLGLATVYGIVKQNNGFINVYSEPGKGTTIKIYLPRYAGDLVTARKFIGADMPQSKGETILLVEDEESILKLGKRMLERLAYTVIDANSPEKAITLATDHTGKIHMLITDVVMPGMNGRELANLLKEKRSELKVLFMSGYTANVIVHRGVLDDDVCFIQKPFSQAVLANKVREALDQ
jgi:PAS domain S-box-containing protein